MKSECVLQLDKLQAENKISAELRREIEQAADSVADQLLAFNPIQLAWIVMGLAGENVSKTLNAIKNS